ncbi:MAG: galactokinase [Spirochaetota bacterium]
MDTVSIRTTLENGTADDMLTELYGADNLPRQRERYVGCTARFSEQFGDRDAVLVSAPGRTELGGNHTDHNHGKVLAAGINLDAVACASPADDMTVRLRSVDLGRTYTVDLSDLDVRDTEKETTDALVRGMAAALHENGRRIGGFSAVVQSDVLPGSGLSSSASFEVVVGTLFNVLYNNGRIAPLEIAGAGQYAENTYFGKPCGLMDQAACAYGGLIFVDFLDPEEPVIERVSCSFRDYGYVLVVVDTGGSHADLTDEYAAVPREMKAVASFFGRSTLRELPEDEFLRNLKDVRAACGDRAVLRSLHFFRENSRVEQMITAVEGGDIGRYLRLVNDSGRSSFTYLQNVYAHGKPDEQPLSVALALTERFLDGDGASRIQGGGFAGTIEAYIPLGRVNEYAAFMESAFMEGCVTQIGIRQHGAVRVL